MTKDNTTPPPSNPPPSKRRNDGYAGIPQEQLDRALSNLPPAEAARVRSYDNSFAFLEGRPEGTPMAQDKPWDAEYIAQQHREEASARCHKRGDKGRGR
jgi:hypothetical protein